METRKPRTKGETMTTKPTQQPPKGYKWFAVVTELDNDDVREFETTWKLVRINARAERFARAAAERKEWLSANAVEIDNADFPAGNQVWPLRGHGIALESINVRESNGETFYSLRDSKQSTFYKAT